MSRYEFALLRFTPDPVGGEFANVGVVMFDVDERRLLTQVTERYGRFSDFLGDVDGAAFRAMIRSFQRSLRDVDERFRQGDMVDPAPENLESIMGELIQDRATAIQISSIMGGVHADPEARLRDIFDEFVARLEPNERLSRTEDAVHRDFDARVARAGLGEKVSYAFPIQGAHYQYQFHSAWQNHRPQVLEAISFDLLHARSIVEKAVDWTGRLYNLSTAEFLFTGLVAPPADPRLEGAFLQAVEIMRDAPNVRDIVPEAETNRVIEAIRADTETRA